MCVNRRYIDSTRGICTHARLELPEVTQVFVVVLVLCISSANERPCSLIPQERSGSRSVSDLSCFKFVLFQICYFSTALAACF